MTTPTLARLTRRSLLGAGLACLALRPASAAPEWRHIDPVAISAEDIAWFRACRAVWIDCESGAPGIVPGDMTLEDYATEFDKPRSTIIARMERLVCAFFLHARFTPGTYAFRQPLEGRTSFTVTPDHIRLLQTTSWRGSVIDCKRPYGDYVHFEIDMARALGLPVVLSPEGYDEIGPENEARMDALHGEMLFVLQAYLEHAEMRPGDWFIPYDGWEGIVMPRCVPVGADQVARYKATMAAITFRGMWETPYDLVVPRINASVALFAVKG
ncbi:hypothetical protein SAMN04244548_03885 [Paracoccus pantotrophus]|nr:hypothetical protein SAMN04244548_03885 [Paracoccus pantotrophus]